MADCETCPTKNSCQSSKENCLIENNPYNEVKKVIAVMSGKGGVGKSTITALLAKTLRKNGHSVGILDADITGPSIPRLLNVKDQKVESSELGMLPVRSAEGIRIISLNLLMTDEEQPVIWRGPIISNVVKQFWKDAYWGDLDYLIVDMPPGTADVALTVMQSIPINGMVMVTTPQDMVSMIVAKAINMARTMKIPVIGIIENMSCLTCPSCQETIKIFEDGAQKDFLERLEVQLLVELPMCREIAALASDKMWDHPLILKNIQEAANKIIAAVQD